MARRKWPKGTWMKLRSADILKAYLEDKEFSLARLARYAGCSKSMIGHLVSGYKTSCTPDLADAIAEALDVPTIALFEPKTSAGSGQNHNRTEKVPA